jgi:hypothetical protein
MSIISIKIVFVLNAKKPSKIVYSAANLQLTTPSGVQGVSNIFTLPEMDAINVFSLLLTA